MDTARAASAASAKINLGDTGATPCRFHCIIAARSPPPGDVYRSEMNIGDRVMGIRVAFLTAQTRVIRALQSDPGRMKLKVSVGR